ncbi:putative TetR-family transcriptional regulator [Actinoplanes missouriensis 431]|uniref:Putative TetR-family transcriptional regulator n=1 Tax=Actinoplanes missouriensis (strain ATCC 14538 / DSM 43046 / CBS 188.64 / JCM 3121 / NBRC 102363 / NCIMB 12654 / NRRL B-3342 / UNCC 431) TaxID=512565 RepID=I0H8I9_ACTM4|nr:TetR/AcrR family transcriptional regulator [Actinoplanes missouriensis]BAL89326.1 putative TetR-family transcriptional regulator [Actinoplanes missouriensis 431]
MTTTPDRRRAPGMTPDQRRDTIVQAALPLVAELGAAVTTATIARAAGIGEATIFRVFDDKNAVLQACVTAAMDPSQVLQELHSIPLEQPLANRLTDAVHALDAHLTRMGAVIGALHATGGTSRATGGTSRPAPAAAGSRPRGRDAAQAATRQAVLELIEPDQDQLRLPAGSLADAVLNLFFGRSRHTAPGDTTVTVEQLVDLLLHGALNPQQPS